MTQGADAFFNVGINSALADWNDDNLRQGDQQNDQPEERLGVHHIAQHAEQGPDLDDRG
jgi:hypothetical protein